MCEEFHPEFRAMSPSSEAFLNVVCSCCSCQAVDIKRGREAKPEGYYCSCTVCILKIRDDNKKK